MVTFHYLTVYSLQQLCSLQHDMCMQRIDLLGSHT